jgi:uncharacterized protein
MVKKSVGFLKEITITELNNGLSEQLTYHNSVHTLDVMKQALAIAKREGVTNKEDLLLLEVAALYHDTGFLSLYKNHEDVSCEKAKKELPVFGFTKKQITRICGIIQATRIPQSPKNLLEQILADADLDYLGRNDFFRINKLLEAEFLIYKIVKNKKDFEELQLKFFETHDYFTNSSKKLRKPVKKKTYETLKKNYILKYSKKRGI